MRKKYAIYTAIFGEYDELNEPIFDSLLDEADFFCFTDIKNLSSSKIKVIKVDKTYNDQRKSARYIKIKGHEVLAGYEYVIWLDASFTLNIRSISEFNLNAFLAFPVVTFRHPFRNCLYEEALICVYAYRDFYFRILKQVISYKIKGMPLNYSLYETGITIFNNSHPDSFILREKWWNEINKGSLRDQIALPFCLWKYNLIAGRLEGNNLDNKYSTYHEHKQQPYSEKPLVIKTVETIEKNTPYLRRFTAGIVKLLKA